MPTDYLEPKQKDFKLLIRLRSVRCANAQSLPQSFTKYAVGDRNEPPEIFILLDQKWSVGSAHPTGFYWLRGHHHSPILTFSIEVNK
jgi:hypothetical protein